MTKVQQTECEHEEDHRRVTCDGEDDTFVCIRCHRRWSSFCTLDEDNPFHGDFISSDEE
jgi:hypothetical protein